MSGANGQTLSSVRNAARVLKAFSSADREFGVSDLARHLDLSKSTIHRILATLVAEQLLEQDRATGRYRVGLAAVDLAAAMSSQLDLHEAVLSPMTDLRNRSGETVQVAVRDGRQVVYVERLDSPHSLRLFMEVGRRNWAHCTGTGKVLLAWLPPKDIDRLLEGWELEARTPHTIIDHALLRKELLRIRNLGFAHNLHEYEIGAVSAGAPIRDATGTVVAALSVAGPAERMEPHLRPITHATVEAAAAISRRLGYRAHRSRS